MSPQKIKIAISVFPWPIIRALLQGGNRPAVSRRDYRQTAWALTPKRTATKGPFQVD